VTNWSIVADLEIPQDLDLDEVAQEYESYGHRVERDYPHHRLAIVWLD
jgi:hypothetical protein